MGMAKGIFSRAAREKIFLPSILPIFLFSRPAAGCAKIAKGPAICPSFLPTA
jgi:hypothetical protein